MLPATQQVLDKTRAWLEKAVIGLNLCPFAKAVHVKGLVHYQVSLASTAAQLLDDLGLALDELLEQPSTARETTLLIAPACLPDFLDFNDFLAEADALLAARELEGVVQIASFHPDFQFAGTAAADITNFSNRSPYPILHLLREESIDRAVEAFPQAQAIYETNMRTLEQLGAAGWNALQIEPKA